MVENVNHLLGGGIFDFFSHLIKLRHGIEQVPKPLTEIEIMFQFVFAGT